MKIFFKKLILSSLLTLSASQVYAQLNSVQPTVSDLSYTYAGIRYINQDLDDFNCGQDGLSIYGSYDIQDGWFAQGSFSDLSGRRCGSSNFSAQAGYRTAYNDMFDIYGAIGLESVSPDTDRSDTGITLSAGIRGFVMDKLETKLGLEHHTVSDGETSLVGGAAYWFQEKFAATFDLGLSSDATSISFGAKMNF